MINGSGHAAPEDRAPHVGVCDETFLSQASRQSIAPVLLADIAHRLELRHDWGLQYRSAHFTGSLAGLGISDDPAFFGPAGDQRLCRILDAP
jgi:hypothetical protein